MKTSPLLAELAPLVEELLLQRPEADRQLRLTAAARMSGGAINQNFLIELSGEGGRTEQWVLRRSQARPVPGTHSRAAEFRLFQFAHEAGLCVPEPLALLESESASVSAFRRATGEVDPRGLMAWINGLQERSEEQAARTRQHMVAELGQQLGILHRASSGVQAERSLSAVLHERPACGVEAALTGLRASLGLLHSPASYLRFAVEQVVADRPRRASLRPAVLCHNDFRLGNLMFRLPPDDEALGSPGLSAVLDWEFAHWSDPMADIGWLTAPCWRFGGAEVVAGIGPLSAFMEAYGLANPDAPPALDELPYWQRFAQLRWALIAAQQGERAIVGQPETLELRITGAMAASLVHPVVEHYLGHRVEPMPMPALQPQWGAARDLLQSAAQHLRSQMPGDLPAAARYGTLMASNAIRLAYNQLLAQSARSAHPDGDPVEVDLSRDLAVWAFRGFP